jgi:hypothetical protein
MLISLKSGPEESKTQGRHDSYKLRKGAEYFKQYLFTFSLFTYFKHLSLATTAPWTCASPSRNSVNIQVLLSGLCGRLIYSELLVDISPSSHFVARSSVYCAEYKT